jgi:V8-like Glu-specific endopeptidase
MSTRWLGREDAPAAGIAVSPRVLEEATVIVGKDELTVDKLAEILPPNTKLAESALERIIGPDERLDLPAAIQRIMLAARAVAHLSTRVGASTGFMIGRDRLMTNNHVFVGDEERVATAADAEAVVTFNYEQDINGKFAQTKQYSTAPREYFVADLDLDCAVVAVTGAPGDEFGAIPIPDTTVTIEVGEDVFIIQHPNGGPKQIAMAGNEVAYVDDRIVQYTTDTLPGSSGAPVFDWQWRLVALHHKGGDLVEPATGAMYFRNEGIRLTPIISALGLS